MSGSNVHDVTVREISGGICPRAGPQVLCLEHDQRLSTETLAAQSSLGIRPPEEEGSPGLASVCRT